MAANMLKEQWGKRMRRKKRVLILAILCASVHSLAIIPHTEELLTYSSVDDSTIHFTRRKLIQNVGFMTPFLSLTQSSRAAAPITQAETHSASARLLRAARPKPIRALRPKLQLDFAVLLMRSSYNALDEIDCVAMDQFQRDFFLIRQAEYEPYVNALGPGIVQQGDLTDPYYFDFISFAQYQTINREITKDPPSVFIEKQPIQTQGGDENGLQQFSDELVKRNPVITNDLLASKHAQIVGASIIDRFEEVYGNTPISLPQWNNAIKGDADVDQLLDALTQLVKLFVINGFAWDGSVSRDSSSTAFVLKLQAPATLWAGQGLALERCQLRNDFLLKAACELVRRRNYRVVTSSVKLEGANELSRLTVGFMG
ncbi:hypothetical protein MPSEU_000571300 [Mayamaea pseudoterrestris]|nr:hypothetical protein MPSEU_000571300 [Mayamaea pseudoterrestris]